MDMSATYRSGAPACVTLVADAFHLVNSLTGRETRRSGGWVIVLSTRMRSWGCPARCTNMLRYNIENLDPDHLAVIIGVLDADADGEQIAAVWIAQICATCSLGPPAPTSPRAQRGRATARQLLHMVRGQRQRPREKPRQDDSK